jgi:2-oxoglutarate dehydrogenase E2 component (dihydrolipoamide succinyltransferase)
MGVSVAEGTITQWKKRAGEWIEADETIVEIDTDKVETEVPAPASGRVKEVLVEVGETVDVGTVLATIDTAAKEGKQPEPAAEHPDATVGEAGAAAEPRAAESGDGASPAGEPVVEGAAADARAVERAAEERPRAKPRGRPGEVRTADRGDGVAPPTTPVVRRMADEHDIDLSRVEGTGRRGRITKKDVLAYLRAQEEKAEASAERVEAGEPALHMESPYQEPGPAAPEAEAKAAASAPGTRELSLMRKRIADHMVRSVHTAAHCTTIVEADMSRVAAVRGRRSYLPYVARATISALREHPTLNATLEDDRLTVHEEINLGIAVSLGDEGLIVPVVRNAHELSHEGLAARITDLATRARDKQLAPDEVHGGTFTISSPGAYGAVLATPIINQPQVAILDLEAVVKRPVVVADTQGQDSIAIRPMTYLCMSWDHRTLDGALAAQFLSTLKRHLEGWRG